MSTIPIKKTMASAQKLQAAKANKAKEVEILEIVRRVREKRLAAKKLELARRQELLSKTLAELKINDVDVSELEKMLGKLVIICICIYDFF